MFSICIFQAIAGYDNGLDPRQHRDITVPKYSQMVKNIILQKYIL